MKIGFFGLKNQGNKEYFIDKLSNHELIFFEDNLSEMIINTQQDFDIISIFVGCKLNQQILNNFFNLKMVAVRSAGFDNVDLGLTRQKNIIVSNVPSYGPHTVAEFTFGLILSLSRHIPEAVNRIKDLTKFNYYGLQGFDLKNKTLGVIGTGRIGAQVIKIAKGFGMKVLAFDLYENNQLANELDFSYVTLEELLKNSDIVTLHAPATKDTYHIINSQNTGLIKKGALLINTARGTLIETSAILSVLKNKQLGGAALDVLENEGKLPDNKLKDKTSIEQELISLPNVILTPHMAFYSKEAEEAIMQNTVENIKAFLLGDPINIVS